ncbi:MAG: indolepyruvate oxidoreductase subunit beta [candidate division WOR-3 bacterium]|nr:MAG: indolepyruvate oxidoreductase subunit beta [candidate division WOR-3 bacterium]
MNVLICGVGGQGVILFSDLLSSAALSVGLDVKKSEVHGMAQRGGSVNTHVRFGPKVHSPLIEVGTADLVVAFEMLEAVRYVHFLSETGRLLYDTYRLDPLPVKLGMVERPDDDELESRIRARAAEALEVNAFGKAVELGNQRVQNVVMLGAVSRHLELPKRAYLQAIRNNVKKKYVDLNLMAFEAGAELAG